MSNAPTVLLGGVPLMRAIVTGATGDTATTVTADDSGSMFVSLATAEHTYTLPAVADCKGKFFWFYQADTTAAVIVTSAAADMYGGDTTGTAATSASALGNCALILSDGTNFYLISVAGPWTCA